MIGTNRPGSQQSNRQSISRARTPLGHYASSTAATDSRVGPRSSVGGSYASTRGHGHSASVSHLNNHDFDESVEYGDSLTTPTPSRRTTLALESSGIPTPGGLKKRQSATGTGLVGRRISSGPAIGDMGPPVERRGGTKKLSGVDETY